MNTHEDDLRSATDTDKLADLAIKTDERRELVVMRAGVLAVAVFADETDGIAEARAITPLPHAPPSVLGVASVRGRMRTVLDPFQLLSTESLPAHDSDADSPAMRTTAGDPPCFLVTLSGDEQLALSATSVERTGDIQTDGIEPTATDAHAVRGVLRHGDSNIFLLDPSKLFDTATQSSGRRRQRLKQ